MIDQALVKMIAKDLQPVSFVENEGFREFVQHLEPRYAIPGRKSIMSNLLPKNFDEVKTSLAQ